MRQKFPVRLLSSALVLLFVCCNTDDGGSTHSGPCKNTAFQRDIPQVQGKPNNLYTGTIWTRDFLGALDTLENGFDSLQIRLWYEADSSRSIIVIKKHTDWRAELYRYDINHENQDSVYIVEFRMHRSTPRMGWNNFIDSLIRLDALVMPDQSNIPGLNEYYNANTVNVEVATRCTYRFYSFGAPDLLAKEWPYAQKMVAIMNLIESELGFPNTVRNKEFGEFRSTLQH